MLFTLFFVVSILTLTMQLLIQSKFELKIQTSKCNPLPNSYILRALSLYMSWEGGCDLDFEKSNFELQPSSQLIYTESYLSIYELGRGL